mmetsp:Transcript_44629/g.129002  ORF Transcript_44629/g.129002 Transcript_44629/m.129002 type:complete len:622 (-) Transcript_44629:54-1919(-)
MAVPVLVVLVERGLDPLHHGSGSCLLQCGLEKLLQVARLLVVGRAECANLNLNLLQICLRRLRMLLLALFLVFLIAILRLGRCFLSHWLDRRRQSPQVHLLLLEKVLARLELASSINSGLLDGLRGSLDLVLRVQPRLLRETCGQLRVGLGRLFRHLCQLSQLRQQLLGFVQGLLFLSGRLLTGRLRLGPLLPDELDLLGHLLDVFVRLLLYYRSLGTARLQLRSERLGELLLEGLKVVRGCHPQLLERLPDDGGRLDLGLLLAHLLHSHALLLDPLLLELLLHPLLLRDARLLLDQSLPVRLLQLPPLGLHLLLLEPRSLHLLLLLPKLLLVLLLLNAPALRLALLAVPPLALLRSTLLLLRPILLLRLPILLLPLLGGLVLLHLLLHLLHPQLLLLQLLLHVRLLRSCSCGAADGDHDVRIGRGAVRRLPPRGRARRGGFVGVVAPDHVAADLGADPPARGCGPVPLIPEVDHDHQAVRRALLLVGGLRVVAACQNVVAVDDRPDDVVLAPGDREALRGPHLGRTSAPRTLGCGLRLLLRLLGLPCLLLLLLLPRLLRLLLLAPRLLLRRLPSLLPCALLSALGLPRLLLLLLVHLLTPTLAHRVGDCRQQLLPEALRH